MKPTLALTLAVALAPALSACGDREPSPALSESAAAFQRNVNTDTLMVDGQPVPITFHEFKGGATFPAQFQVRYPEGMAVTADRAAMGDVVQLTQSADTSAGVWSLTFLPEGTTEDAAKTTAKTAAEALGTATDDPAAGALAAFGVAGAGTTGRVWLGQHAGRYVVVRSSAADAAWGAFEPRADFVEQHWTWTDDGSTLAG